MLEPAVACHTQVGLLGLHPAPGLTPCLPEERPCWKEPDPSV